MGRTTPFDAASRPAGAVGNLVRRCRPRQATLVALALGALLGAAVLLVVQASGAVPPPPPGGNFAAEADSDLILSIREPYLSRAAADAASTLQGPVPFENVRVDVLPGRLLRLLGDVRFMGQRFQAIALMTVGVSDGRVRLQVHDVHLGNLALPIDLNGVIADPINRQLARVLEGGQFEVIDVATADDRLVIRLAARGSPGASQ